MRDLCRQDAFAFLGKTNQILYKQTVVDWQSILRSTTIILPLQVNSLVLGLGIVVVLGVLLDCYTLRCYKKEN